MNGLKRRVAENLTVSVAGKIVSGLLGVISIGFTTRALGADGFGQYALVLTILYVFSVLGGFGLDPLLAREIAKESADEEEVIGRMLSARIVLLCAFLLAGIAFVFFLPYPFAVAGGVAMAAFGALFFSLAQLLGGVFQKRLKTIVPACADVAARGVQLAFSFFLYRMGAGIFSFLFVFTLGGALNLAVVYWWVASRVGIRFHLGMKQFYEVVREGWPLAVSAILTLIYFRGDTIILSLTHSLVEVGVYGVAYKVLEHAIFIPIAFAGLVMPLLARYFFTDRQKFQAVFQKSFDFLAVLAVPFAAGGAYLSADIARLLGGSGFERSADPLQVLFLAIAFIFFGALFGNALIAMHKQKIALWAYGAAAALNVPANLYFISGYSYMGAAWVTTATEALVTLCMFFLISRFAGFLPSLIVLLKALVSAGAMLAALYALPFHGIITLVPVGAGVYFACMYALGGVSKDDLLFFFKFE